MKTTSHQRNLAYTLCLMLLLPVITASCVSSTIAEEMETRSVEIGEGWLALTILNNAENTLLQIDSLEICNVPVQCSQSTRLAYGADTTFPPLQLCVQTLHPWDPCENPSSPHGSYATIYGSIYTLNSSSGLFLLAQGPMYTPVSATITANITTQLTITLYPNCPLYISHNGTLEKVLQSIQFSPIVIGWE